MTLFRDSYLSKFTFDSFITGESNQDAVSTVRSFISRFRFDFDILYIKGPVGCGKTHLAGAVANEILHIQPGTIINTVSVDRIIGESWSPPPCNVLIVDSADLIIANHPEILTEIIDHCKNKRTTLIVTACNELPPKLHKNCGPQMRTAHVQRPDRNHLRQIAKAIDLPLLTSTDVEKATSESSSIRELEGILRRRSLQLELAHQV